MKLWNIYAKHYNFLRSNLISAFIQKNEMKSIQKLISLRPGVAEKGSAVDLGTGTGSCLRLIPPDIVRVFAIDNAAEMVALTRREHKEVEVCLGDACSTPYPNNSMDLILCIGLSEYLKDCDSLLSEIKRIIRTSGTAIFTSSPPNLINHLRKIIGHSLFLRTQSDTKKQISQNGFLVLSINRTAIQDQFLITPCFNFDASV